MALPTAPVLQGRGFVSLERLTMVHAKLGHIHLQVRDLARSVEFYTHVFGLRVVEQFDTQYAFLTGGALHHEVALRAVGTHAPSPSQGSVGLYHAAFEVADKAAFAEAYSVLVEMGLEVYPVDHGISWAMYFGDPDGNGLEIYADTRREQTGNAVWRGANRRLSLEMIKAAVKPQETTK